MTAPPVSCERRRFPDLPGWFGEPHLAPAFAAFRRSAPRFLSGDARSGTLGVSADSFREAAEASLAARERIEEAEARAFFERFFVPLAIRPGPNARGGRGFLTGYYEPVVPASPVRTAEFQTPLYAPPDDLVKVDDETRPDGLDPSFRFARRRSDGQLDEHPDRGAITDGALDGRGLEIAWLADPVDAFFIHVQGSARLEYPDGRRPRVTYAAKTGHPFTAIGRILVEEGELRLEDADMDGIRRWLAAHPARVDALLRRNRSFIFFREAPVEDEQLGPVAAAKVPLEPLASIAVDRELHTFGVPVFVGTDALGIEGAPFRRLTVAQDTGSAILGPARADLFVGSGREAGSLAGRVRHAADFALLVPEPLAAALTRP
ncbi:murein transglycosylase A [Antarcticirhabdus aurantiaca]|uniref:MltA domain-containing protein n=1 Tax=Antarcticirhabdus aurantiaca TaxID=2606717 RepID=A0ACD4NP60_9HYPH|nr:MltA domain-containing protein [Antarcticirhabdus aurantiaca]WAJ28659.1 MltA domain-containing protein [Jeongeuplla avenae]